MIDVDLCNTRIEPTQYPSITRDLLIDMMLMLRLNNLLSLEPMDLGNPHLYYNSVSIPNPWAVAGPHWQLASLIYHKGSGIATLTNFL